MHLQQGYSLSATAFRLGEATEIRGKHGGKRPPSGAARTSSSSSNSHSNNSGTASKGANTALAAAQRRAGVNFSIGVASKEHSAARDAVVMPWEHKVQPTRCMLHAACYPQRTPASVSLSLTPNVAQGTSSTGTGATGSDRRALVFLEAADPDKDSAGEDEDGDDALGADEDGALGIADTSTMDDGGVLITTGAALEDGAAGGASSESGSESSSSSSSSDSGIDDDLDL